MMASSALLVPRSIKVLSVEDSPADTDLIVEQLREAGFTVDAVRVEDEAAYLRELSDRFDVVLSDFALPQFTGTRALELLQQSNVDVPLIIVSGTLGEERAVDMMRLGATDCVLKERLGSLPSAVERALRDRAARRERDQMAAALRDSELRLRAVTESAHIGLVVIGEDHRYRYANSAYAQIMRHTEGEVVGKHVSEVCPQTYEPQVRGLLDQAFARERVRAELSVTSEDETRWYTFSAQKGQFLAETVVVVVLSDITEEKRKEAAIRAGERRFRDTLDLLMEGCQIISREWRYLYVNEVAARHSHHTVEQLMNRSMLDVFPEFERSGLLRALKQCMDDGVARTVENEFIYAGKTAWFQLCIQPVPEGLFILSLDITARKLAEREVQAQLTELQRWHEVMLGREERIIALKREVNMLSNRLGEPLRYREGEA